MSDMLADDDKERCPVVYDADDEASRCLLMPHGDEVMHLSDYRHQRRRWVPVSASNGE